MTAPLSDRERRVLEAVIETYVQTAEPAGSRTIAKRHQLGLSPATGAVPRLSLIFTILYFSFFLFMPFYTRIEKTKPVPTRVTW